MKRASGFLEILVKIGTGQCAASFSSMLFSSTVLLLCCDTAKRDRREFSLLSPERS
jgi:hypothetical protein